RRSADRGVGDAAGAGRAGAQLDRGDTSVAGAHRVDDGRVARRADLRPVARGAAVCGAELVDRAARGVGPGDREDRREGEAMIYCPDQLMNVVPFVTEAPTVVVIAGPADANEAQTAKAIWPEC